MLKKVLSMALIALMLSPISLSARKGDEPVWGSGVSYQIETVDVAARGTKLVKSWAQASKVEDAIEMAMRNAVSAAIFQGLPASASGSANATPPLCKAGDGTTHSAYFSKFFAENGPYKRFVNRASKSYPSGRDNVKVGREKRVGVQVKINFDELRAQLEADGVIRGLSSGF